MWGPRGLFWADEKKGRADPLPCFCANGAAGRVQGHSDPLPLQAEQFHLINSLRSKKILATPREHTIGRSEVVLCSTAERESLRVPHCTRVHASACKSALRCTVDHTMNI